MKIGVLGYGSIGKRHFKNAVTLGHEVATYDPDPNPSTCDRDYVIDWADAIIVASPTERHVTDLHDCISSGKHVLVEKPIGHDDPDLIRNILSYANIGGKIVATGFNLRFHDCVQETVKVFEKGILGEIVCASFSVDQLSTKEPYLRDGVIRNWLSHEIDLAHFLFGEGEVIQCTAPIDEFGKDSKEAFIEMKFSSVKNKVFIQGDYYTSPEQRYWWIEGTEGTLYCNMILRELYMKVGKSEPKLYHRSNDSFDQNYIDELKIFINAIETGDTGKFLATGDDGVRSLRTVMAARKMAGLE
jgi:predicted dehydrogenase